eukprot:EC784600.1.p2 GENE.EC784600.1~~EC784600.1.p2  ORF type:complete len:73 (+),score=7.46 EC784600.1:46-264(+)
MTEPYWTVSRGVACRYGWQCRECRQTIAKGDPVVSRDGRKIRLFYHEACVSRRRRPANSRELLLQRVGRRLS